MIERIFDVSALIFLALFALLALGIRTVVGAVKGESGRSFLRGLEAGTLAFAGGIVARATVSILLGLGGDSAEAGLAVAWAFFLWPGAIDTIPILAGERWLTTPEMLLWIAAGVGGFTGMMAGSWTVHRWQGIGGLSFLLDVTWGLAGSTNAALLHLINFAWASHGAERRAGAHRYLRGFAVKPGFAFTQGPVMSSNQHGPGTPLYAHEMTHVWQNRAFGPLFVLSYIGWMAVMFIPGLIVGASKLGVGAREGIEKWCYFNNPWEAWGYAVQGVPRSLWGALIWSDGVVIAVSIIYFTGFLGLVAWMISAVWV